MFRDGTFTVKIASESTDWPLFCYREKMDFFPCFGFFHILLDVEWPVNRPKKQSLFSSCQATKG